MIKGKSIQRALRACAASAWRSRSSFIICLLSFIFILSSCSTKKNTAGSRFYHSFASRFNILYNGEVAYKEGFDAQLKGNSDDYTRLLPMTIAENKTTAAIGKSNYETAITKSEKAIKLHSIKKRPTASPGKRLTEKEKLFRQRKEFNPRLSQAWMMMGKSQYNMGEFVEAASTFSYMQRLYATQPEIVNVATAWLARCYVAMGWPYDAETLLDKTKRDSMSLEGQREREATTAAYLIQTGQYAEAMPHLRSTIKRAHGIQRARLNFLAGQLESKLGNQQAAYKHYQRVIRSNPPYEMAINARILQSEVVSGQGNAKSIIRKLQRMTRSDKNKDYLDQLYYAIGNIYLAQGDTAHAIGAYEEGAEKSTKNGAAKAQTLLRLSQLYWQMENYIEAARTYAACVGILDKEHEEYKEAEERSQALTPLEPHLSAVKLQDSLQRLAKLPEAQRLEAIDRVIEALKKKEKEEAKKAAQANAQPANTPATQAGAAAAQAAGQRGQKGAWYFYNPQTLQRGAQEFQRKWGKRANEDLWRYSNREALSADSGEGEEGYNYDDESADSIAADAISDEEQARLDSLANDPHERAYYLAQIPFEEDQLAQSNQLLADGLYNGGLIVMRDIQNLPYARRMLQRLLDDFPDIDADRRADVLYHLFLLTGHMGDEDLAAQYRQQLISQYPEDKRAILVGNPLYEQIAREGKHLEDTTYQQAYAAYERSAYAEVGQRFAFHTENFPQGAHRARILFVQAMSQLYSGNRQEFLRLLEELVRTYGKDEVAEMANEIVKGIKEGRLLSDSKYDQSDIWRRRRFGDAEGDSLSADTLRAERYTSFSFVLAYPTDALDENILLYELARYNFSSYMVRNFEIDILDSEGLSMMCVRGFQSYDEVHAYAQRLYADRYMFERLQGIRSLLISDENLAKIGVSASVADYEDFYQRYLRDMALPENTILDEPTDILIIDPDDALPAEEEDAEEGASEDDFPYGF